MKKIILFVLISLAAFSQSLKVNIAGSVADTLSQPLEFATVLLLEPSDSTLIAYTLTDIKGKFEFKNIKRQEMLIKASFVGLLPVQEKIEFTNEEDQDLGNIILTPISQELYEVVVKTAKAPISIKGDTIEYDASKFKVPPGSSVEDLLRKLPGMEIGADGEIIAQGEQVQKVTVDGKRFFGGNTKMATKNLGADVIKKVQVFDDSSEESKITGIEDGKREKTVNLELKDEAKKGAFGKVTAGLGTDQRSTISGNYNKFDKKNQFSLVGFGNNLNQTGLSWDDYQDFKGSNSYRWADNADFGFSNSGFYFFSSGGGDEESFNIPIGGNQGEGFSRNASGGMNYNFNEKKTEISSSYYYNFTEQTNIGLKDQENFLNNGESYYSTENSRQVNKYGAHRLNLRAKIEPDSTNTLVYIGNGRLGNSENTLLNFQEFFRANNFLSNQSNIDNGSNRENYGIQNTLIYRHKFKKKGRNFAISGNQTFNNGDLQGFQNSLNTFYSETDENESIKALNLANEKLNTSSLVKGSVMFLEPFAKYMFWETFYNISNTNQIEDKLVKDGESGEINSPLTGYFTNQILYNRLGSGLRYSNKGMNLSLGLAYLNYGIEGLFYTQKNQSLRGNVDQNFGGITPNLSMTYSMKNNKFLNVNYTRNISAPSISQLSPIIDNSNPLYISSGNADLKPEKNDRINLGFNMYNPASFVNLYVNLNHSFLTDQIIYSKSVDPETLITETRPVNFSGGKRSNLYLGFGFPLKKTKATMRINTSANYSNYFNLINDEKTETTSLGYNISARLSLTPVDWFTFYGSSQFGIGNTKYTLSSAPDQKIINNSFSGEMNIKLPKDFYFSSVINYNIYKNQLYGFENKIPILSGSIYKLYGKNKRLETRVSVYDALKRNLGISQYANYNVVSFTQIQTLSRYFMFSVTYNFRGVASSDIKKQWF